MFFHIFYCLLVKVVDRVPSVLVFSINMVFYCIINFDIFYNIYKSIRLTRSAWLYSWFHCASMQ